MNLLYWHVTAHHASTLDEQGWLRGRAPLVLLAWLRNRAAVAQSKDGRRRLRLFACACARRHWDRIGGLPYKDAAVLRAGVLTAERFADGEIDRATFEAEVAEARRQGEGISVSAAPAFMAGHATLSVAFEGAWEVARLGPRVGGDAVTAPFQAEQAAQCDVIREIFGNPFRPVARPACLPRKGGPIRALAETIYRERTYAELPILADALEDAGCDEPRLLEHLRGAGPHVRGCWAIDLLRG